MSEPTGRKDDDGKLRYDLIPPGPLANVAAVYTFGARKYEAHNWRKGLKFSRLFAATMRHLWLFWGGEDYDSESKLPHLAHAAFGIFSMLEFSVNRKDLDDRYRAYCNCKDERACKELGSNTWVCSLCGKELK